MNTLGGGSLTQVLIIELLVGAVGRVGMEVVGKGGRVEVVVAPDVGAGVDYLADDVAFALVSGEIVPCMWTGFLFFVFVGLARARNVLVASSLGEVIKKRIAAWWRPDNSQDADRDTRYVPPESGGIASAHGRVFS